MIYARSENEKILWEQGYAYVVGIDEVGRGCWAGPAVVAAVIFPRKFHPEFKLADSKKLSEKKRKELIPLIQQNALCYAITEVPLNEINTMGVGKAIQNGFSKIVTELTHAPDYILIDGFKIQSITDEKQHAIIKGDEQSISIAAASILAKDYRDQLMKEMHTQEPRYGFDTHVGYGTVQHREALKKYGLSQYHRTSYDLTKWLTTK